MNNHTRFLYILFLASLMGCYEKEHFKYNDIDTGIPLNVFIVPGNLNNNICYFQSIENHSTLFPYDLDKQEPLDPINLPISSRWFQLYEKNKDSIIYIDNGNPCKLSIINADGEITSQLELSNGEPFASGDFGIIEFDNTFFMGNKSDSIAISITDRGEYYSLVNPIYQFDVIQGYGCHWGSYPKNYIQNIRFDAIPSICPISKTECILSYQGNDSIYFYKNKKLIKTSCCKSKYIDTFSPYPKNMFFDMQYYKKYMLCEPRYSKMIYDPFNNRLLRIVEHRKKLNKNGTLSKKTKATWSIMIISSSLMVEKEILFDAQDYVPHIIIPYKDGILISKTPDMDKENKTIHLRLSLIVI